MNINRDPIAPLGVIFPPFNLMDPKQSQKRNKFSDYFGQNYTFGGSEGGNPMSPSNFTSPSRFSQQRKT